MGGRLMSAAEDHLFEELFLRYHRMLVAFLTRMTRCPQRAEDLAQVAWLKLLHVRSRGAGPGTDEKELRAYLFTVGRNAFLDEYTRKHAAVRTSTMDPALLEALLARSPSGPGPDEALERQQVSAALQSAVGNLPPEQRKVILMWARGTSIQDMATACAAPTDTVLSRKKYALARMRTRLAAAAQDLH